MRIITCNGKNTLNSMRSARLEEQNFQIIPRVPLMANDENRSKKEVEEMTKNIKEIIFSYFLLNISVFSL